MHRHIGRYITACWHGLPVYFTNLVHPLSTTSNGATYPPPNTRDIHVQIPPLLPVFCCWLFTSATFKFMWTNGEAKTNKQSIYLDAHEKMSKQERLLVFVPIATLTYMCKV